MNESAPIAVIKVGGDVVLDKGQAEGLSKNVKDLIDSGWRVVLLHGGGPQVNRLQELQGLKPNKVSGRRITSLEDLEVVKQAVCGEVNVTLMQYLQHQGVNAFACNGASGKLITAKKRAPILVSGAGDKPIDFGEVGDVVSINTELLNQLLTMNIVPVIATLGVEQNSGRVFNINADTTVVEIARSLKADMLLLTTAVGAIFEDLDKPISRIAKVNITEAKSLIEKGVIQGGMIPKVEEALKVLKQGVKKIAIVSPKQPGAFLAVANNQPTMGTIIQE